MTDSLTATIGQTVVVRCTTGCKDDMRAVCGSYTNPYKDFRDLKQQLDIRKPCFKHKIRILMEVKYFGM